MGRSSRSSAPPPLPLATGTEVSPPSRSPDLPDRRAAARARLGLAEVHLEPLLERALGTIRVAEVVDRRAPGVDSGVQDVDHRIAQARQLLRLQRPDRPQRVDLREP